jgi:hypothetical protein
MAGLLFHKQYTQRTRKCSEKEHKPDLAARWMSVLSGGS